MTYKDDLIAKAEDLRNLAIYKKLNELHETLTESDSIPDYPFEKKEHDDRGEGVALNTVDATTNELIDRFAYIVPRFERFADPNPNLFDGIIAELGNAYDAINYGEVDQKDQIGIPGIADVVKGYTEDWTGDAAEAFSEEFLPQYATVGPNHLALLESLKGAMEAYKQIFVNARIDIVAIADSTIAALEVVDGYWWDTGATGVALSILSAVAGSSALAAKASASLILSYLSAGNTAVGEAQSDLDQGCVDDVMHEMNVQINDLISKIQQQEEEVAKSIRHSITVMSEHWESVLVPRPELADASNGDVTDGVKPPAYYDS